jgi:ribonuclease Y
MRRVLPPQAKATARHDAEILGVPGRNGGGINVETWNSLWIIAILLAMGLGCGAGFLLFRALYHQRMVQSSQEALRAREAGQKEAEALIKEARLQAKETIYQAKQEFERETKERRSELQKLENRLLQKEEHLDKKVDLLDQKEMNLAKREKAILQQERSVEDKLLEVDNTLKEQKRRLEGLAGITAEEARDRLIESIEADARERSAKILKRVEDETRASADKKAKEIISLAIQRYASDYVSEKTVSLVSLPNEEMKGRIIGREGRNIRALEAATGIDLIIDDTPEAVILSGYNPVRREVARISLERLISDGRIHPARIEEIVEKVRQEMDVTIRESGEQAAFDVGVHGINAEIIKLLGTLKYRTSFAQNVLQHSLEVAFLCGIMASELGLSVRQAKRAGLLHDIGKAVDHEVEGSHALIGAEQARRYGEAPKIVNAIAAHHDEEPPQTVMAVLVQAADALSAARPGARKEMLESYVKRLDDLERIANSFPGVGKSYAIQAGREVRIAVESEKVNDDGVALLSYDIARKIEKELTYPGQIKVTVIRETRAVQYAK